MLLATTPATYRAPDWGLQPERRAALRALVADVLPSFEAVAVTHDSAVDTLARIEGGFRIRDRYRPQLEANGSAQAGESIDGTVFASLQFRPVGSTDAVLGVTRYGEVAIHWRPSLVAGGGTTISPVLSRSLPHYQQTGGGYRAGTAADMVDIATDALIAQHSLRLPSGHSSWLYELVRKPIDAQRAEIAGLLTAQRFHETSPEVILRGAAPTADAIEAVTILTTTQSPELDEIRAWAVAQHIPVHEGAAG